MRKPTSEAPFMLWLALVFAINAWLAYGPGQLFKEIMLGQEYYQGSTSRFALELLVVHGLGMAGVVMLARRDMRGMYFLTLSFAVPAMVSLYLAVKFNYPILKAALVIGMSAVCIYVTHWFAIRRGGTWRNPKGDEVHQRRRGRRIIASVAYKLGPTARVWLTLLATTVLCQLSNTVEVARDNIMHGFGSWNEGPLLFLIGLKVLTVAGVALMWRGNVRGDYLFAGATFLIIVLLYGHIMPQVLASQGEKHALVDYAVRFELAAQCVVLIVALAFLPRFR